MKTVVYIQPQSHAIRIMVTTHLFSIRRSQTLTSKVNYVEIHNGNFQSERDLMYFQKKETGNVQQ